MRPAKIVAIVVGAILVLIGLALLAPGGFLLWAHGTQRDADGFYESSTRVLATDGYALATLDVDLHIGSGLAWIPNGDTLAVRIQAESTGTGPLFLGIGPTDRVTQYLANVSYAEVEDFGWMSSGVQYHEIPGGAPSAPPGEQDFWVARREGPGLQTLEWGVKDGNWTAVIMNGDATAPVTANVSLGGRIGLLLPIGIGLTAAGVVLLAVGILLIVLGARHPRQAPQMQPPYGQPPYGQPPYGQPPQTQPPYAQPPQTQPPNAPADLPQSAQSDQDGE